MMLKHGQRRFASRRIARKRPAELANAGRVHDFGASRDRGHGQAASERFGHRDQIGFESQSLAGKHRASARESSLHFIGDQQNAVFATDRAQALDKTPPEE